MVVRVVHDGYHSCAKAGDQRPAGGKEGAQHSGMDDSGHLESKTRADVSGDHVYMHSGPDPGARRSALQ